MRRTVRPFIKEFKSLPSKSAPRARVAGNAEKSQPILPPPDPSLADPWRVKHEDGYKAALEAADAVFGKRGSEIPAPARPDVPPRPEQSPPAPPTGRVLPSLIEQQDDLSLRLKAAETARPGRKLEKAKAARPVRPKKRTRPAQEKPAAVAPVEQPSAGGPVEEELAAAPRKRRSIRARWAFKTELKPGENWKRRLCKAAR
jgi:hypothetical protein